jgi:hypothetical protein
MWDHCGAPARTIAFTVAGYNGAVLRPAVGRLACVAFVQGCGVRIAVSQKTPRKIQSFQNQQLLRADEQLLVQVSWIGIMKCQDAYNGVRCCSCKLYGRTQSWSIKAKACICKFATEHIRPPPYLHCHHRRRTSLQHGTLRRVHNHLW